PPLSAPMPMSRNLQAVAQIVTASSPDLSPYSSQNQIAVNQSGQIPASPMSSGSWPGVASSQQYPGSSQSGSISRQVVATAYDASGSVQYNPSASVQIIEAPGPSLAMKVLIAVTTMAAVFFLFAAAMALKNNLGRQAAAPTTPAPPTAMPVPTPTEVVPPPEITPTPLGLQNSPFSSSSASSTATPPASASALSAAKQKTKAPSSPRPRPTPVKNCDPPFTRDANGVKIYKPECL
ncbi:MAG: hypothetical protein ACRELY_27715, partial [Polyangiaceae bacterium]